MPTKLPLIAIHNTQMKSNQLTTFFNVAKFSIASIFSREYSNPHSVSSSPGSTALTLIFGPCVVARHFMRCSCAALVTLYGMLLPLALIPAILELIMNTPPSALALNTGAASRNRYVCAFTLTAKHLSQSSVVGACRSAKVEKRVKPWGG